MLSQVGVEVDVSEQIVAAHGIGKQAVMSDTVESLRQDVDEEAADELVGVQGHGFLTVLFFLTVVFPFEGNAPSWCEIRRLLAIATRCDLPPR